jgi:hypothetical protein
MNKLTLRSLNTYVFLAIGFTLSGCVSDYSFTNADPSSAGSQIDSAPLPTPSPTTIEGCSQNAFGQFCQTTGGAPSVPTEAHAYLYNLTPVSDSDGQGGVTGSVDLITAADRIQDVDLYTTDVNVPLENYTQGFPGYTSLTSWFGVCYDGGYTAPMSGNYTLVTAVDDSVAIWIDGNLVMNSNDGTVSSTITNDYVNGSGPNATQFNPDPVAAPSINLSAGPHSVMIEYMQAWPTQLGVQVWIYGPVDSSFNAGSTPPSSQLMQLSGPPGGVFNCPH